LLALAIKMGDLMAGDPEQPGAEGALTTEVLDAGPCLGPGLLAEVLRIMVIIGLGADEMENRGMVQGDELAEGGGIGVLSAVHQNAISD
jgi:hypothetical protein